MVTADELGRSLRGSAALLNRRPDALSAFEISEASFWRSFGAIALTLPAFVVSLALARRQLGLDAVGSRVFDDPGLALLVGTGHLGAFLAVPIAMIFVAGRLGLGSRYVPFVIVTNWVGAFGSLALAAPGALMLLGWQPPSIAALITVAFAAVLLHVQWFAARVTLEIGAGFAALVTAGGFALSAGVGRLVLALA